MSKIQTVIKLKTHIAKKLKIKVRFRNSNARKTKVKCHMTYELYVIIYETKVKSQNVNIWSLKVRNLKNESQEVIKSDIQKCKRLWKSNSEKQKELLQAKSEKFITWKK